MASGNVPNAFLIDNINREVPVEQFDISATPASREAARRDTTPTRRHQPAVGSGVLPAPLAGLFTPHATINAAEKRLVPYLFLNICSKRLHWAEDYDTAEKVKLQEADVLAKLDALKLEYEEAVTCTSI